MISSNFRPQLFETFLRTKASLDYRMPMIGAVHSCAAPICPQSHTLVISGSYDGTYATGFVCDLCRSRSSDEDFDGQQYHRWHCSECTYDICMTCRPEYYMDDIDLMTTQLKLTNLRENLQEVVDAIRDDDSARDFLMRKFVMVPRLLEIMGDCNPTEKSLVLEAIWYFSRNAYAVTRIYKLPMLQMLVDQLQEETDVSNIKKITRALYNTTLSTPASTSSSGLQALSQVNNFIDNLAIPLLLDDTVLLTVCLDILDALSNSVTYFKSNLVYPPTPVLYTIPTLLARGDGIASRTAYFMWVMVAIDNNKKAFCACEGVLQALKRLIDEDFDGARANAFGTLWNLAALAVNKIAICQPALGFLSILVRLINEGDDGTKVSALGVTSNLSVEVQNKPLLLEPSLDLLPALVRQVRESQGTPRVTACQTLMNLAASEFGAYEILKTGVHVDMLDIIRNAPNDPAEWGGGSNEKVYSNTCIMNLAEWESNRPVLKRDGAVEVLGRLLTFNHFHSLTASMAYAFLVGRDEQGPHVEILRSGVIIIERLIDLLENTIGKSGGDGYQYGLFRMEVVVHACLELSLSDANKVKLAVPRVRDLLIEVIKNACPGGDGVDLYNSLEEVVKAANVAVETLLQLSFTYEDSNELISDAGLFPTSRGLLRTLTIFAEHVNADTNGTHVGLLLSRLTLKTPRMSALQTVPLKPESTLKHLMISYCWNKKAKPELVAALYKTLRHKGYEVWRDCEGSDYVPPMSGTTDERMAEAIDHSYAVIICVSKEYKQSPNCRMEANYASQRFKKGKTKLIYVMMQEEYTTNSTPDCVDGYLASMIGDTLWCPLYDEEKVGSAAEFIADIAGDSAKHIDGYRKETNNGHNGTAQASSNEFGANGGTNSNDAAKIAALEAKIAGLELKVDSLLGVINKEFGVVKNRLDLLESTTIV